MLPNSVVFQTILSAFKWSALGQAGWVGTVPISTEMKMTVLLSKQFTGFLCKISFEERDP